jgi:hypothetical protein
VLNIPEPLEYIEEYKSLGIEKTSREFILFTRSFLSENRAPPLN